jgi:phage regulator Rha-like protein
MKNYDIIIIGGGISGIYTMYNLKKKYPTLKVLLLEKDNRFGGRIYTYFEKFNGQTYKMDLGAGRLGFHHKRIMNLLEDLKLKDEIIPITNTENYIEYDKKTHSVTDKSEKKREIVDLLYKFFNSSKIANFTHKFLKKFNLMELFSKFFSREICETIQNSFEYKCKLKYFNADDAVYYFKHDYNKYSKFFVLKNGLHIIIDGMLDKIKTNKNYVFKKNQNVKKINYNVERNLYNINYDGKNSTYSVYYKFVICALPRKNLIKFDILSPFMRDLNSINEIAKMRIFEIYDTKTTHAWFKDLPKLSTNEELEFVIPIDPKSGLIMSSYNENLSTNQSYWLNLYKKSKKDFKTTLNQKLNNIFSVFNVTVPQSIYVKLHYWSMGVAAWKKNVDSKYISQKIINLMPNFYICGENYSNYQAWCEGSLQTSEEVINRISCILTKSKHNKTRKLRK